MKSQRLIKLFILILFAIPCLSWGHARLVSPTPRTSDSGLKTAPCGNRPRTANPTVLTAGSQLIVRWTETQDHVGRYIIAFSAANDQNFLNPPLGTVIDAQNVGGGSVNHSYSTTVTVPTTPCENCTLRLIQSMEENPASPSLYYSCADIRIVAATTPPIPPDTTQMNQQSISTSAADAPQFGGAGCGQIQSSGQGPGGNTASRVATMVLLLIPLLIALRSRRQVRDRSEISRH